MEMIYVKYTIWIPELERSVRVLKADILSWGTSDNPFMNLCIKAAGGSTLRILRIRDYKITLPWDNILFTVSE